MAALTNTTVLTNISGASYILDSPTDMSEWYKLSHCVCPGSGPSDCLGNGLAYLHVRTPVPADASGGMGWNPYVLEVTGYHTYSAECFHDFKAVVNTTGDGNNTWYGSQVRINRTGAGGAMSPASNPYVYRSATTYGGYSRMCFAVRKTSCCCTGYIWVRWWTNAGTRTSFSWGTFHSDSQTTYW